MGTVALLLATALVACGGDDDDDDAAPADSGGGAATQQASPTANADDSDDDDDDSGGGGGGGGNLPFESGSGGFTVDGEQFDAEWVVSCEPFDASEFGGAEPHEDDFDVTAAGGGNTYLEVEVSFEEVTAFTKDASYTAIRFNPFLSRSGAGGTEQFDGRAVTGPEGDWYPNLIPQIAVEGVPPDDAPLPPPAGIEIDGSSVRGALTLTQSWPEGASGTVDVTFDLELPSEVIDCSTLN